MYFLAPESEVLVDRVWPLYGPVAGGTQVTITGQYVSNITAVYFGQYPGFIDKYRFISINYSRSSLLLLIQSFL